MRIGDWLATTFTIKLKVFLMVKKVRIFLSYQTKKNMQLAGDIKKGLEYWGVDVFLAHEDIRPSRQWRKEIIENIRNCDVFMPLLTKHFRKSEWTDQESGMAVIESKIVIPLSVDATPHGFLADYQAHKLNLEELTRSCERILSALKSNSALEKRIRESFIQSFVNSQTFSEANEKSEFLEEFGPYNKAQVKRILRGCFKNSQISGGFTAMREIKEFYSRNSKKIDEKFQEKFNKRFES